MLQPYRPSFYPSSIPNYLNLKDFAHAIPVASLKLPTNFTISSFFFYYNPNLLGFFPYIADSTSMSLPWYVTTLVCHTGPLTKCFLMAIGLLRASWMHLFPPTAWFPLLNSLITCRTSHILTHTHIKRPPTPKTAQWANFSKQRAKKKLLSSCHGAVWGPFSVPPQAENSGSLGLGWEWYFLVNEIPVGSLGTQRRVKLGLIFWGLNSGQ